MNYEAFEAYLASDGTVDFDLWAQNSNDWLWLQEFIPGIIVSSAGGIMPFQAEGLLLGYPFYFKDRHGVASLNIGAMDGDNPYLLATTLYRAEVETEEYEGSHNFVNNLMKLIPLLEKVAFPYRFQRQKVTFTAKDGNFTLVAGETETTWAQGFSKEEAYARLGAYKEFMDTKFGWTRDFQKRLHEAAPYDPEPLNQDERIFPTEKPDFRVNYLRGKDA